MQIPLLVSRQTRPHRLTRVHCGEPYLLLSVVSRRIHDFEWTLTHSVNADNTLPAKSIVIFSLASPLCHTKWSIKVLDSFVFIDDEQLIVDFDGLELFFSYEVDYAMLIMLALLSLVQLLWRSDYLSWSLKFGGTALLRNASWKNFLLQELK